MSADLALTGSPVSLGSEVGAGKKNAETIGFGGSSDFVYAFRIRKIVVTSGFMIEDQDDVEGGALGDYYDELEKKVEVKGLEGSDSRGTIGQEAEEVGEDGGRVLVTPLPGVPVHLSKALGGLQEHLNRGAKAGVGALTF